MNLCFYTGQVKEELDGAASYINLALKLKKDHPDWAAKYAKMSDAELDHATNLIGIFEDDFRLLTANMKPIPDFYNDARSDLLSMYNEFSAKVKYMHETYAKA